jgi:hypothetical protein
LKKYSYLALLLPLALFISFLDGEILKGFLSTGKSQDHFSYLGILVAAVAIIIFVVLQFDKKSNE